MGGLRGPPIIWFWITQKCYSLGLWIFPLFRVAYLTFFCEVSRSYKHPFEKYWCFSEGGYLEISKSYIFPIYIPVSVPRWKPSPVDPGEPRLSPVVPGEFFIAGVSPARAPVNFLLQSWPRWKSSQRRSTGFHPGEFLLYSKPRWKFHV